MSMATLLDAPKEQKEGRCTWTRIVSGHIGSLSFPLFGIVMKKRNLNGMWASLAI